ncbi:MAG: PDZ domain-containing protein [Candidatus Methylacidiphilales bacterium]|nr:PDZ domain-containing protein [Candidatus Methylacidiphilales bacterium]
MSFPGSTCIARLFAVTLLFSVGSWEVHAQSDPKAGAPAGDEIQELRREIEQLRARVSELEKRIPADKSTGTVSVASTSGAPKSSEVPADVELPQIGPSPFNSAGSDLKTMMDDPNREAFGFGLGRWRDGFAVTYVYKGSEAERAGLLPRDIIYNINGQNIAEWSPSQLASFLDDNKTIKLSRSGRGKSGPVSGFSFSRSDAPTSVTLTKEKQSNFLPSNGIFEFVKGTSISLLAAIEGQEVPNFSIVDIANPKAKMDLRSLCNSWILVVFAENWGENVLAEEQSLIETAKALQAQGLKVVVVSLDKTMDGASRTLARTGSNWWYAHDGKTWDNEAMLAWGVSVTPTISLVAPNNILRREHIPHDRLREIVAVEMDKPIAEPQPPTPSPIRQPRFK